jgi:hypothetical protein
VWAAIREVVPTVERTGIDEGYLDVGEVAPDFRRARVVAEAVQAAVRGATSLSCSLGVASCKVVAKVASDRKKPGGITVSPRVGARVPARFSAAPGGPRGGEAAAGASSGRELAALPTRLSPLLPDVGRLLRDRAQESTRAARRAGQHLDQHRRRSPATCPIVSNSMTSASAWRASPPAWRSRPVGGR